MTLAHILSLVCGTWNNLVHDNPGIWSSISIRLAFTSPRDATPAGEEILAQRIHDTVAAVQSVLELSEEKPLCIDVYIPFDHHHAFVLVLQRLVSECHRWQSIRLRVGALLYNEVFLPISGKLPLLRSLEFHGRMGGIPLNRTLTLFQEAPSLRDVRFCILALDEQILRSTIIPWSQITFLTLSDLAVSEACVPVKNILDRATRLQTLHLGHEYMYPRTTFAPVQALASPVQRLILDGHSLSAEHREQFSFESYSFPNLTDLEIDLNGHSDLEEAEVSSIRQCLFGVSSTLTSLTLSTWRLGLSSLTSLLGGHERLRLTSLNLRFAMWKGEPSSVEHIPVLIGLKAISVTVRHINGRRGKTIPSLDGLLSLAHRYLSGGIEQSSLRRIHFRIFASLGTVKEVHKQKAREIRDMGCEILLVDMNGLADL